MKVRRILAVAVALAVGSLIGPSATAMTITYDSDGAGISRADLDKVADPPFGNDRRGTVCPPLGGWMADPAG